MQKQMSPSKVTPDAPLSREDLGQHILTAAGSFVTVRPLARMLAIIIVFLVVAFGIRDGNWDSLIEQVPTLILIWLVGVVVFRGLVQLMRVHVYANGIEGRSFGGFRRRFLWQNIAGYRFESTSGLPQLVIVEAGTNDELWMLREIGERDDFRIAVAPYFDWQGMVQLDLQ